jgi:hypothetical protein
MLRPAHFQPPLALASIEEHDPRYQIDPYDDGPVSEFWALDSEGRLAFCAAHGWNTRCPNCYK